MSTPRIADPSRAVPILATALWLLACGAPGPARDPRLPLVEMEPARAAREALAPMVPGPPQHVELGLAFPEDGTIFSAGPEAYLAGRLDFPFGVPGRVDAVVVIDTSHSTSRSIAGHATEDRVRARVRGPAAPAVPEETILDAELASARQLLENVDPRNTRLGVVSFSGAAAGTEAATTPSARTEVELTRRLDSLGAGLQRIAGRGASGRTDMAAGLDQAVDELLGRGGSRPDPAAQKVVVFFTDGTPTLPHRQPQANELAVMRAAERAAAYGIRVFTFAVGPDALGRPVAAVEMARRTSGVFTPVRDPRDLAAAVSAVRFMEFDEFTVRNLTVGSGARKVHLGRDGTFDALVPLEPGKNRIYVRAVVGNVTAEAERWVHYAPGSARPFVPAELEDRLLALGRDVDREIEVRAGPDAALQETLRRDRLEYERRAARQLKELELQVDVAAPPPGP